MSLYKLFIGSKNFCYKSCSLACFLKMWHKIWKFGCHFVTSWIKSKHLLTKVTFDICYMMFAICCLLSMTCYMWLAICDLIPESFYLKLAITCKNLFLLQPGDTDLSGIPLDLGEFGFSNVGGSPRSRGMPLFHSIFFYNELSQLQSCNISWTNYVINKIENYLNSLNLCFNYWKKFKKHKNSEKNPLDLGENQSSRGIS